MRGLKGKRILVAGSASGIGAATARRLAAEGAHPFLGDIDEAGVAAVAAEIGAVWSRYDLADAASITAMVATAADTLGGLDGVANVAADLRREILDHDGDLLEMDLDVWRHTLNSNLVGFAWTIKEVLPHLMDAGGGAIVNVSSDATVSGYPVPAAYAASKAGINTLARHVATRWGKAKIRCNSISPGAVLSDSMRAMGEEYLKQMQAQTPHERLGEPDDLAASIAFLLSDDGAWVTGQVWSVNGGTALRE
jgi:NAD(P)-dependent dehydrogenase (short-subunit alcohol dehydrogenase family)